MIFENIPKNKRFIDITGKKYGRLTVLGYAGKTGRQHKWHCRCDCGNTKSIIAGHLKNSSTKSCGCLLKELMRIKMTKHNMAKNLEYYAYISAKSRCNNIKHKEYKHYGGRGIKFLFSSFEEFYNHIGPRPNENYSLDRINNDSHYVFGNIRWASKKQQMNNRRNNVKIFYRGKTKTLSEWCLELDLKITTVHNRIHNLNWSIEESFKKFKKISK